MTTATLSPGSAKVKFRLAGGAQPLILLPVQVNGDGPFEFILDTGAGTSLLSSELAKKLKIKIISTKEGQSAGGKISVSLAKVDSLAVGQAKLDDVDVGIVDLDSHWEYDRHENRWRCRLQFPETFPHHDRLSRLRDSAR